MSSSSNPNPNPNPLLTPKPEPMDREPEPENENPLPIVPVSTNEITPPVPTKRSSQLVRVTNLTPEENTFFINSTRKTRILYESARLFAKNSITNHRRPDLLAGSWMRQNNLFLNKEKRLVGNIPGLQIGDVFLYRMEMVVLGLHGQVQAGIDYVASPDEPVATSVIVSGGYEDDVDNGEVVVYSGHGGQDRRNKQQVENQTLEYGNLGLDRSLTYGVEVRVVRGVKYEGVGTGNVYVYDGLYKVMRAWFEYGKSGFGVFKFEMVRVEGQEEMGSKVIRFADQLKKNPIEVRERGYLSLDLSKGNEVFPVLLFNDVDEDVEPLGDRFSYVVKSVFSVSVEGGVGCECEGECGVGCFCHTRNGGEIPYDWNGVLLRGKPVVYECGPQCKCKSSCRNRVAQNGVRYRFEVFRTVERGWGVRSLDLIPAGTFICEYAGVLLTPKLLQLFTMNGNANLVYPTQFPERWREWGDLSQIFTDYEAPLHPSIPQLDLGIDVSNMRNVAYYIRHSSSPNLFVQLMLYDHNNVFFPRIMLFAMENIPPLRELTLDYGAATDYDDDSRGKLAICG